ncbi:MAG TPA: urease accessory UreF family protein [Methylibium sp.]|nr:urease accessory UreF family protein [Methylibium sp.]
MPRVRRPAAPTSAATLLSLIWLASPALPVGGFSYSEGLEAAVDAGLVHDEASTRAWLLDQLALGLARSELPLVAAALAAWRRDDLARVRELNDWLLATRETAEARLQTEQMGRSLAAWLQQRPDTDPARRAALAALAPAPTYPVAWALAAAGGAATPREAALAYAFGWAENLVQAALKAVPLGQSAGQRILGALADAIPGTVDAALTLSDGERLASLPGLAILGARHETQYSRLFRS